MRRVHLGRIRVDLPEGGWPYPVPSDHRCTIVDLDRLLRCPLRDGHGWGCQFDASVDQALCLSWRIGRNGRARFCCLRDEHDGPCIYIVKTEQPMTLQIAMMPIKREGEPWNGRRYSKAPESTPTDSALCGSRESHRPSSGASRTGSCTGA